MDIDSEEISDFVKAVLRGIQEGVGVDQAVATSVKFQIDIASKKDNFGALRLSIVGIGAKRTNQQAAHIEFEVDDRITVIGKKFDEWMKSPSSRALIESYLKQAGYELKS